MAQRDWVFVAGQFMSVNSVAREGFAVLDAASGRILATTMHAGLTEPLAGPSTEKRDSKEMGVGNVRIVSRVAFIEVQASPRAFADGASPPTFTFPAQEDVYYDVEASTDLVRWELLGRWRAPFRVQDNAPAGSNYRFYRAWPSTMPGRIQLPIPPGSTGGVMRPFSPSPAAR